LTTLAESRKVEIKADVARRAGKRRADASGVVIVGETVGLTSALITHGSLESESVVAADASEFIDVDASDLVVVGGTTGLGHASHAGTGVRVKSRVAGGARISSSYASSVDGIGAVLLDGATNTDTVDERKSGVTNGANVVVVS